MCVIGPQHGQFVVLLRELPVVRISFDEARDDDEAENQEVDAREHLSDQGGLPSSQSQQSCGEDGSLKPNATRTAEADSGPVVAGASSRGKKMLQSQRWQWHSM